MNRLHKILIYITIQFLFVHHSAYAACWEQAGLSFQIPPALLYAIAQQESGLNAQAIGKNRDGSRDIGLMQINSRHLPNLEKLGIDEQQLLNDSCLSVFVGASILAEFINRYGYSWEAVGAYNAGTSSKNKSLRIRYAKKIWERYQQLQTPIEQLHTPTE
jgi:soluble lytic murein transglycosylase-like protein